MSERCVETFGLLGVSVWDESPNSECPGDPRRLAQFFIPLSVDNDDIRAEVIRSIGSMIALWAKDFHEDMDEYAAGKRRASTAETPRLVQPPKRKRA